ncbi:hypothetical protein GE061_019499 [Apolygus lucorum]|uniref:Uncharacterized protein n=1 Tax=Apolygus lucorum TaxID=248454 RepID=A0A6A4JWM3_APOLU|nr:hypothetical protein GE061_019499 [Apolygus lucorum]
MIYSSYLSDILTVSSYDLKSILEEDDSADSSTEMPSFTNRTAIKNSSVEGRLALEQRSTWKSKYEHLNAVYVPNGADDSNSRDGFEDEIGIEVKNGEMKKAEIENGDTGKKRNVLVGLSGYLSSSDDDDSSDSEDSDLNSEVELFLKEVDNIYGERRHSLPTKPPAPVPEMKTLEDQTPTVESQPEQPKGPSAPTVAWQECYDSSTGFAYYWNVDTNEVTWDIPIEYQLYLEAMKQWQQAQAQAEVAALMERARNQKLQQQQQHQLQQQQLLIQQAQEAAAAKQAEQAKGAKKMKAKRKRSRRSSQRKSDSEDEEKIELITSYGPNSGDESESDHEPPPPAAPPAPKVEAKLSADARRKKKLQKMIKETAKRNSAESQMMGPQLPAGRLPAVDNPLGSSLVPYRDADSDPEDTKEEPLSSTLIALMSKQEGKDNIEPKKEGHMDEDDESVLLDRLRCQTQVLQELGGEIPEEIKSIIVNKDGSDKGSLVPSYSEGSEDEGSEKLSSLLERKIKAKDSSNKSATTKPGKADGQQLYEPEEALSPQSRTDSPEPTAEPLPTIKRKFKLEIPVNPKIEPLVLPASGKDDLKGLGFSSSEPSVKKTKTEKIMFVKAETLQFQDTDTKATTKEFDPGSPNDVNIDIKDASSVLLDKMQFLAAAKDPVSPVQLWAIQLETLLAAWESQNLKTSYFENWLTSITKELETLESTVAPEGWRCEWQRSEKCYSYRNVQTQLVVWEYPQREDKPSCGGEEDMEVCTTPPPPPTPPKIAVPSPPPPLPPSMSPPPLPPTPHTPISTPSSQDLPPLPPLPPMPPPPPQLPPSPPPPPPDEPPPPPPPDVHLSEPLPPGVDPPDVRAPTVVTSVPSVITPPLPPQPADYMHIHHVPMHHGMAMPVIPHQMHYTIPYPTVALPPSTISAIPQSRAPEMHNLSTELDSFYSDIASMEPEPAPQPPPPQREATPPPPPPSVSPPATILEPNSNKKKKKTKLAPGLALKKKGVSSLVAKWQQVQEDVRRDMKHIED